MSFSAEFISNKNLENYCCICSTKELADYEYFTLFQVSEKGTEAIFIREKTKIIGELIFKINKEAIQILLLCSKNSKKGVGTFAIKTLESYAKIKGIKIISLISEESAIGFYKKLNYTQVSENNFIKEIN